LVFVFSKTKTLDCICVSGRTVLRDSSSLKDGAQETRVQRGVPQSADDAKLIPIHHYDPLDNQRLSDG
jgi:hypothetical protein